MVFNSLTFNTIQAKLQENIEKCNETESACNTNEDGRRAGEARSFAAEQSLESMETELEEANAVATASNHKFEDVTRKLKVIEGKSKVQLACRHFTNGPFQATWNESSNVPRSSRANRAIWRARSASSRRKCARPRRSR